MINLPKQQRELDHAPHTGTGSRLMIGLWAIWTLAVMAGGYIGWHNDILAGRPFSLIGMAIDAIIVGVIGLIVLTLIEMRLNPEHFL